MPTTAVPALLTDPGYLFTAPLLSTEPTNTVAGSKFTDAWPVAWIGVGATESGSTFGYQTNVEAIAAAEFLDPLAYRTVSRAGRLAFAMMNYTLTAWKTALNGGALTVVSGTGATQLNKYEPPAPGAEVRAMLGWESLDNTMRIVIRQALNAGNVESAFAKAPAKALIPCEFQFEVPATGQVFTFFSAGAARA